MAGKRGFDRELEELSALREVSAAVAGPAIAKALGHKNNLIVSRAAALAARHQLRDLAPQLEAAFRRFMEEPAKTDPQCWAKNAIAKTLAEFEWQQPEVFLAGLRHLQMEPVWGGQSDTAGPLRSACAMGLTQCRSIGNHELLLLLVPLFADAQLPVRVDAARAVHRVGTQAASLLLRLRAQLGSDEPELLGACCSGVLSLEGAAAIRWAAEFMPPQDGAAGEAAIAIAETHAPEAFLVLRHAYDGCGSEDFREVLLAAIALTRQDKATEWLLAKVKDGGRDAAAAHTALCRSAPAEPVRALLRTMGRPCAEE